MLKTFAPALVLALCASPAAATNWLTVGHNTYGSTYEIDQDSVVRDGAIVKVSLRVRYGPNSPPGPNDGYVAHRTVNCQDNSFQDIQTDYMLNGKVRTSSGVEEKQVAQAGSIAESVVAKACGR
jgi:hypothetical protein